MLCESMVIYMEMKDITTFCENWLTSWTGNNPEKLISFYSKTAYYQDPANPKGLKGYDNIAPSAHSSGDTLNGNNLIDEINAWILKTDGFYQPIDQQSLTKQQWGFSKAIAEKIGRKDLLSDVLNYLHHDGVLENGFLTRMAVSKIDEALENIRLEAHIAAQ